MIYAFVYGNLGVFAEACEHLERPKVFIELDDDVDASTRKGELVKYGSAHRITGLQDTCRQIRLETEDFNPLWKAIRGTSEALIRVFDQPNPFEFVRAVTIHLEPEDITTEQGKVSLSEKLQCLLVHLACLRYLKLVSLPECNFTSGLEEKEAFDGIWNLLAMGPCIRSDFELLCLVACAGALISSFHPATE